MSEGQQEALDCSVEFWACSLRANTNRQRCDSFIGSHTWRRKLPASHFYQVYLAKCQEVNRSDTLTTGFSVCSQLLNKVQSMALHTNTLHLNTLQKCSDKITPAPPSPLQLWLSVVGYLICMSGSPDIGKLFKIDLCHKITYQTITARLYSPSTLL